MARRSFNREFKLEAVRLVSEHNISVARHNYILSHLRLQANAGRLDSDDLQVVNQLLE